MRIVDTHTHAGINWFEPVEMLIHQMNLNGVEKAVLIQHGRPQTGGYDHAYLFECVERFPGRFAVVVIVDVTNPDALDKLEGYKAQGAVGVRLNPGQRSPGGDPLAIWRKADELGLVVSSMGGVVDTSSDEFSALVAQFPNLPIIIEHMAGGGEGAAFPANGPGPQPPYTGYKKALELAKYPNTYMKLHGMGELSRRPDVLNTRYNFDFYDSMPPLVELARDAFGPRRLMWGSDYPPVSQREGYRNALLGVLDHPAFNTQEDREWVMSRTALSVFKFE
ncbi:MAG: amidohydrolase [Chloroflexi bacterium]|nr:amidohydrolase [Chloroflexota bacterium]